MENSDKETIEWLESVYKFKISIHESKITKDKQYWANIVFNKELESTDYFKTYNEAVKNAIHIAFKKIK